MTVDVHGWARVEARGVVGRVGDRFPLAGPFGVVATGGERLVDGPWTPFGMTLRVEPTGFTRVDLREVGYDEVSQTSVRAPGSAPATQPGTKGRTQENTDGAGGPDSKADEVDDIGWD